MSRRFIWHSDVCLEDFDMDISMKGIYLEGIVFLLMLESVFVVFQKRLGYYASLDDYHFENIHHWLWDM